MRRCRASGEGLRHGKGGAKERKKTRADPENEDQERKEKNREGGSGCAEKVGPLGEIGSAVSDRCDFGAAAASAAIAVALSCDSFLRAAPIVVVLPSHHLSVISRVSQDRGQ